MGQKYFTITKIVTSPAPAFFKSYAAKFSYREGATRIDKVFNTIQKWHIDTIYNICNKMEDIEEEMLSAAAFLAVQKSEEQVNRELCDAFLHFNFLRKKKYFQNVTNFELKFLTYLLKYHSDLLYESLGAEPEGEATKPNEEAK